MFIEIADLWTNVSILFNKTGKTKDIKYINEASKILVDLSKKEKSVMELILKI